MTTTIRRRLIEASLAGRYDLFLGLGAGLAILGLILFIMALTGGQGDRAWQLFHVNWLYFTGLAAGSVAFAAVQKITNAKWSGVVIRFAEASAAFLPISFLGMLLIFTVGYEPIYGPMAGALHELQHGKAIWLSHPVMFVRVGLGLTILFWVGWKLIRADLVPDLLATRADAGPGRRAIYDRWIGPSTDRPPRWPSTTPDLPPGPTYAVLYALVATIVAFDGVMALQPHWFSNLLGGFYFMGSFLGPTCCSRS
jgi:hypothetical protein